MYFTDTPELRKFEREMKQKPNFDRHSYDSDEIKNANVPNNEKSKTDIKVKEVE